MNIVQTVVRTLAVPGISIFSALMGGTIAGTFGAHAGGFFGSLAGYAIQRLF